MNLKFITMIGSLIALMAGGAMVTSTSAAAEELEVEELTRGPIHEAFAAAVSFDPEPGIVVKSAPPPMIDEVPPDQRLEGDHVVWIPGYWGWDDETNDFIWISGVWRNLPPGRQWVPGYWGETDGQWQWTSGYWADEAVEEVAYLPKPPKSIESGPNVEAPSENHIWISGTWVDQNDRYAWRPGYWELGMEDRIWIPAYYQWTRCGYIFIDGYWDYNVVNRGVVFAPVHFRYYNRPGFAYTPVTVINLNVFSNHLFVRPSYCHYYFGDYYAPRYINEGFYASMAYRAGRCYDPIYAHSRWVHRADHRWERSRRESYAFYRDNQDARPPHTWAAMQSRPVDRRGGQRDDYQFAAPLNQYANHAASGQRFAAVSPENRSEIVEQRQKVREFSSGRQQLENRLKAQTRQQSTETPVRVNREKIAKSPVSAKRDVQADGSRSQAQRRPATPADALSSSRQPDGITRADPRGGKAGEDGRNSANSKTRPMSGAEVRPNQNGSAGSSVTAQPPSRPTPQANAVKPPAQKVNPRTLLDDGASPRKSVVPTERKPDPRSNVTPPTTRPPQAEQRPSVSPPAVRQPQAEQRRAVPAPTVRAPQVEQRRATPAPVQRQPQFEQRQSLQPQINRRPEQTQAPRQYQAPQRQNDPPQRSVQPQPQRSVQPQNSPRNQFQQTLQPQPQRQAASGRPNPGNNRGSDEETDPQDRRNR